MGRRHVVWIAALVVSLLAGPLAGCSFYPGGDALAFLRQGRLWTIQRDGANAHQIAGNSIASFSWSPDHHQIVYRMALLPPGSLAHTPTTIAPDASGELHVISVNGGSTTPITPPSNALLRSDAWWNASGNRLLYIERVPGASDGLGAEYIVSQADQPVGIARKSALDAAILPALSADGARVAVIDSSGMARVGAPDTHGKPVVMGALLTPGAARPARLLWRPGHEEILFMNAGGSGTRLVRSGLDGKTTTVGDAQDLLDAAFAPDGSRVLARTSREFLLWSVAAPGTVLMRWPVSEGLAIPYWSPDGKRLLIFSAGGAQLVDLATGHAEPLLSYSASQADPALTENTHWRPATSSPWSPDGTQIAFIAAAGDSWRGQTLTQSGLYVASIAGGARLIDSGSDQAPSWSYLDPASAFLAPS